MRHQLREGSAMYRQVERWLRFYGDVPKHTAQTVSSLVALSAFRLFSRFWVGKADREFALAEAVLKWSYG